MTVPDPSHIMQVGMGFWGSKALLSAVELGLITELAKRPMSGAEIVAALGLAPRAVTDFPDALVALKLLHNCLHLFFLKKRKKIFQLKNQLAKLVELFWKK
jgi:hypothetical protein